jgi:DNA-directed RNA polymerase subunit RPC12/RpoP
MPTFRCTNCDRRVNSPVVIGAGDCPHCGGDVVFDIRGSSPEAREADTDRPRRGPRSLLGRLRRR